MPQICLYFQLHQPYRLRDVSLFEVGEDAHYFVREDDDPNQHVFQKVASKSYLPMLQQLEEMITTIPGFKVSLSCSGVFLEQAQAYQPEVIQLLQRLAQSPQVEFLAETYYHSLASIYSANEFQLQVRHHQHLIKELLGVTPSVFRNTELIYVNELAQLVSELGFKGLLTEAVPRYLKGERLTQVFRSQDKPALPLLLKHAQLSDDIAFRFSDRSWHWYPLSVSTYLEWVEIYGQAEIINLFMDFETFGEHQWADTGIFTFFREFCQEFIAHNWNSFVLPSEVFDRYASTNKKTRLPRYDVPHPISWADIERDLTAWTDNDLQKDCLRKIYELEPLIMAADNPRLLDDWRKLQTSDHFYYMCTKWAADGDVHAYFSPYDSPFEAYRRYSIVLADLIQRVQRQ